MTLSRYSIFPFCSVKVEGRTGWSDLGFQEVGLWENGGGKFLGSNNFLVCGICGLGSLAIREVEVWGVCALGSFGFGEREIWGEKADLSEKYCGRREPISQSHNYQFLKTGWCVGLFFSFPTNRPKLPVYCFKKLIGGLCWCSSATLVRRWFQIFVVRTKRTPRSSSF